MKFSKYHALGNDYLILDPQNASELPNKKDTVRICHRNFGIGSDGILYGPLATDKADFGLRIMNPDGSEAEKSGNGLRIFSRYLFDTGRVGSEPFTVKTPGGIVTCEVRDGGDTIEVEMGKVSFHSSKIPVVGEPRREAEGAPVNHQLAPHRYTEIFRSHRKCHEDGVTLGCCREF